MDHKVIYQKYLESAIHFLSFRPRSEKEVRDNLLQKKAPLEVIDEVLIWLKEQRFVNDEEFIKWWIEQRNNFKPKSMRIIKFELIQKGISKESIEQVISSLDLGLDNELDMVKKIVGKKIGKYTGVDKREIYQKLGSHLARKGFNWELIKKAIDSYIA